MVGDNRGYQGIIVYFGSLGPIGNFTFRHFSSLTAAVQRIEMKLKGKIANPLIYQVRLKIKTPIVINDCCDETPEEIINSLHGRVTDKEIQALSSGTSLDGLRFDSFKYVNTRDDVGEISYIPITASQIQLTNTWDYHLVAKQNPDMRKGV